MPQNMVKSRWKRPPERQAPASVAVMVGERLNSHSRDEALTPAQVAAEFKYAVQTLANLRCQGRGPRYFKLGTGRSAPVRYWRSAVNEWINGGQAASAA